MVVLFSKIMTNDSPWRIRRRPALRRYGAPSCHTCLPRPPFPGGGRAAGRRCSPTALWCSTWAASGTTCPGLWRQRPSPVTPDTLVNNKTAWHSEWGTWSGWHVNYLHKYFIQAKSVFNNVRLDHVNKNISIESTAKELLSTSTNIRCFLFLQTKNILCSLMKTLLFSMKK